MSRLIVKQLPAYLSDVRLKEHFGQRGLVTDVKLMTRPDGTSRRFGFVGYRTEEEAKDALQYFNNTFIDTSRIKVDHAKKIGDEELAEKRAKRMAAARGQSSADGVIEKPGESSKSALNGPSKKEKKAAEKSKAKGVSFEEFMAVMAPAKKRKTWQNEEDDPERKMSQAVDEPIKKKKKKEKKQDQATGQAASQTTKVADGLSHKDSQQDDREVTPDEALNDEGLTDMDYLARRMKRNVAADLDVEGSKAVSSAPVKEFEQSDSEAEDEDEDSSSEGEDVESDDEQAKRRQEKKQKALEEKARKDQEAVDTIMVSGRLFVRNLPFAASEEELHDHFATFGTVKQAHIPLDKTSKTSKGLAFVTFEEPANALAAYRAADGTTFQGRLLHLLPAVDLRPRPDAPKTLKQGKAEERKAKADKDFNWSMLYMNTDAVASSISARLGVDKADILNPSDDAGGDSAAVRLALAETRILTETKEFLEKEGINVDAFEGSATNGKAKKPRSDTTILVKNIPYGTTSDEIRAMFEEHGDVDRVLIPPTGTIAVVEMEIVSQARVAFQKLAYKRLGNSILYLEKAPVGLVKPSARSANDATGSKPSIAAPASRNAILGSGTGSEADAEPGATLFVKNLSFATTDIKLANLFSTLSDFAFARVQTRVDSREPTKRLSMGYGFVGYKSIAAAQTAMSTLNGKDLDGHALALSFARRGGDADDEATTKGSKSSNAASTKLVVKNLPFEATKKDVRTLFASYGQLKSVRVPRKSATLTGAAGGGARGFAFVEFTTKKEALSAFNALKHTHLLGRHLILGWDKEDAADVEGMREKVKETFDSAQEAGMRRRKEKLKLGEEDIAEASKREREKRQDVDD